MGIALARAVEAWQARNVALNWLATDMVFVGGTHILSVLHPAGLAPDWGDREHGAYSGNTLLPWVSPEQVRGERLVRASSVFSLCAMLVRMLTGVALFQRDTMLQMLEAIVIAPPIAALPPPLDGSRIVPELEGLLLHGLARKPADRLPSAETLARRLEEIAEKLGAWCDPDDIARFAAEAMRALER